MQAEVTIGEDDMFKDKVATLLSRCCAGAAGLALAAGLFSASAQERELKVGYMKNPIQDASLEIMQKWAKAHGVKLTPVPMAYSVFMEKVTSTLTSGADQFDVIWHNDDWGQLWKKWLDTTDDVKGIENADEWPLLAFWNDEKKLTVVPMVHTVGTFFYRTDLVKPEEVPKTFAELVSVSQRIQKEGKVKWGYVGGMSMNNTWFSLWWTMWSNQCDILKPLFERDNEKLRAANFEPAVTEPCHREIVEFWWDAINTHKISPPGMTAYGRNEANAIFMAGDAAFTLVDSTHFGEFNDPKRSKAAGKIGMAPFPMGPRAQKPTSWNEIWGWGIPKGVPAERKKLAKEMLSAIMSDEAGQIEMWKKTGGPPPNVKLWPKLAAEDKDFAALKHAVFDQKPITHSAYYFAEWPAVHKAYSDMAIEALSGKREDIPKVLAAHVEKIRRAATGN
jgi:ABC-type glycerol-3-phosphate transport system substrate-binding protein